MLTIHVKSIYEAPEKKDGFRLLTDRCLPRKLNQESLHTDKWIREMAPSPSLRIWFKHHPEQWDAFCRSYLIEIRLNDTAGTFTRCCRQHKTITLLYSSPDKNHNHAIILRFFLEWLQKNKWSPSFRYASWQYPAQNGTPQ